MKLLYATVAYAAGSFRDSRPPWSLRPCLQRSSKVLPSGQRRTSKPVLRLPSGQWPMPRCGTSLCQRAMRARFPKRPSAAPSRPRRPTAHPPSGDNWAVLYTIRRLPRNCVPCRLSPPTTCCPRINTNSHEYEQDSCQFVKIRGHPTRVCPHVILPCQAPTEGNQGFTDKRQMDNRQRPVRVGVARWRVEC